MSVGELFLYELPSAVHLNFCLVMDTLSDLDWTRFGESQLRAEAERSPSAKKPQQRTDAGNKRNNISTSVMMTSWKFK